MPDLRGLVFGIAGAEHPAAYWLLTILVVAAVAWLAWKMQDLEMAFAMSLVAGLLVGYHAYLQDAVLLLLPFAIATGADGARRITAHLYLPHDRQTLQHRGLAHVNCSAGRGIQSC